MADDKKNDDLSPADALKERMRAMREARENSADSDKPPPSPFGDLEKDLAKIKPPQMPPKPPQGDSDKKSDGATDTPAEESSSDRLKRLLAEIEEKRKAREAENKPAAPPAPDLSAPEPLKPPQMRTPPSAAPLRPTPDTIPADTVPELPQLSPETLAEPDIITKDTLPQQPAEKNRDTDEWPPLEVPKPLKAMWGKFFASPPGKAATKLLQIALMLLNVAIWTLLLVLISQPIIAMVAYGFNTLDNAYWIGLRNQYYGGQPVAGIYLACGFVFFVVWAMGAYGIAKYGKYWFKSAYQGIGGLLVIPILLVISAVYLLGAGAVVAAKKVYKKYIRGY